MLSRLFESAIKSVYPIEVLAWTDKKGKSTKKKMIYNEQLN